MIYHDVSYSDVWYLISYQILYVWWYNTLKRVPTYFAILAICISLIYYQQITGAQYHTIVPSNILSCKGSLRNKMQVIQMKSDKCCIVQYCTLYCMIRGTVWHFTIQNINISTQHDLMVKREHAKFYLNKRLGFWCWYCTVIFEMWYLYHIDHIQYSMIQYVQYNSLQYHTCVLYRNVKNLRGIIK